MDGGQVAPSRSQTSESPMEYNHPHAPREMMQNDVPQYQPPFIDDTAEPVNPSTFEAWQEFIYKASSGPPVLSKFFSYSLEPPCQSRQQRIKQAIRKTKKADFSNTRRPWIRCFFMDRGCKTSMKLPGELIRHGNCCRYNPNRVRHSCSACHRTYSRVDGLVRHIARCRHRCQETQSTTHPS